MRLVWALALLITTMLGLSIPTGAQAEPWRTMHAQSYPATPAAAARQARAMGFNEAEVDLLERELTLHLQGSTSTFCRPATAADGTYYSKMGMRGGIIAHGLTKQHGVDRPVVRCIIGSKTVDWYNQPTVGCNNLGLVGVPKPRVATPKVSVPQPTVERSYSAPQIVTVPGLVVDGCCCTPDVRLNGQVIVIPGGVSTSRRLDLD